MESLLASLLEIAEDHHILIVPLSNDAIQPFPHEFRDGVPYLLLSSTYLNRLFQSCFVQSYQLPAHLYGPNRLLMRITKYRGEKAAG